MEPSLAQAGSGKNAMEVMRNHCSVEGLSIGTRKHEPESRPSYGHATPVARSGLGLRAPGSRPLLDRGAGAFGVDLEPTRRRRFLRRSRRASSLGLAISKASSSSTYFLRDAAGGLLGERTPDGNHWYYLTDVLGSIVAVIDGSGSTVGDRYAYDPYGKRTYSSGSVSNPWGYVGGYMDATGLVLLGDRYYDPSLGRFTQVEPLSVVPEFTYAADDPVNFSDPSGDVLMCVCEDQGGSGGGGGVPPFFYRPPPAFAPAPSPSRRSQRPQGSYRLTPAAAVDTSAHAGLVADREGPGPIITKRRIAVLLAIGALGWGGFCYDEDYSAGVPQKRGLPGGGGTGAFPGSGRRASGSRYGWDQVVADACLKPPDAP